MSREHCEGLLSSSSWLDFTPVSAECVIKATCHLAQDSVWLSGGQTGLTQHVSVSTDCLVLLPEASSLVGRVATSWPIGRDS